MLEAARERLERSRQRPLLIAVTILTSLGPDELGEIGFNGTPAENVLRLARLAERSGADGVVCSPREASEVRAATEDRFLLVTPGVRPAASAADDQRRTTTPAQAVRDGADYLVVGRPITQSADPLQALRAIAAEIDAVVAA
jgi:orotidine-5'-phosphate decarboxylase